ncbi:MAG TPA: DUF2272 domain-containing protein [Pyrinomonadaceae bacterium]|jgi:hypothetical protein
MPSTFAKKLAAVAQDQHDRFHMINEADPVLCRQIKKYWTDLRRFTGVGFTSCTGVAWSAIFVSWCVKQAGATSAEFKFAAAHSVFVFEAIRNALNATGVFQGFDISAQGPAVGDIIQNNRSGNGFDFAFARTHRHYESHSAIVVETGEDAAGRYALTIGGNEHDSVRRTLVRLNPEGLIKQIGGNHFICVLKDLK